MKKLAIPFLCLLLCGSAAVYAQQPVLLTPPARDPETGTLKFETMTHDFGEIPEGPLAEYDFVFTNTGKKPVIITSAEGSCGCTTAKYTKDPIRPGETSKIHVMYNTVNRPGPISKIVTVLSNAAEPTMVLHIKGNVKR